VAAFAQSCSPAQRAGQSDAGADHPSCEHGA
jgi:hypothetical protein